MEALSAVGAVQHSPVAGPRGSGLLGCQHPWAGGLDDCRPAVSRSRMPGVSGDEPVWQNDHTAGADGHFHHVADDVRPRWRAGGPPDRSPLWDEEFLLLADPVLPGDAA